MRKFLVASWLLVCFITLPVPCMTQNASGQDDLKLQLQQIEEVIRKQQEMLEALKEKIETKEEIAAKSVPKTRDKIVEKAELEAVKASQGHGEVSNYNTLRYGVSEEELHNAIRDYLGTEEGKELVTKASPDRIKAGYKVGKGFSLESLDEKFKLNILGRLQHRYNFRNNEDDEDTSSYRINRMRLKLSGHAFTQNLLYSLQWELNTFTGRGQLKDIFVDYQFLPGLRLRGGQWKVPYNRQNVASDYKKQFIDESITNDAFTLDRDIGGHAPWRTL